MTAGSAAFTTTHGVIDRVHNYAAVAGRRPSQRERPALPERSSECSAVAYNADSGLAGGKDLAGFT